MNYALSGCLIKLILLLKLQLKNIGGSLLELWNLMDTPKEDKSNFLIVTSFLRTSESEVTEPGVLSTEMIEQVCLCFLSNFNS